MQTSWRYPTSSLPIITHPLFLLCLQCQVLLIEFCFLYTRLLQLSFLQLMLYLLLAQLLLVRCNDQLAAVLRLDSLKLWFPCAIIWLNLKSIDSMDRSQKLDMMCASEKCIWKLNHFSTGLDSHVENIFPHTFENICTFKLTDYNIRLNFKIDCTENCHKPWTILLRSLPLHKDISVCFRSEQIGKCFTYHVVAMSHLVEVLLPWSPAPPLSPPAPHLLSWWSTPKIQITSD